MPDCIIVHIFSILSVLIDTRYDSDELIYTYLYNRRTYTQ